MRDIVPVKGWSRGYFFKTFGGNVLPEEPYKTRSTVLASERVARSPYRRFRQLVSVWFTGCVDGGEGRVQKGSSGGFGSSGRRRNLGGGLRRGASIG